MKINSISNTKPPSFGAVIINGDFRSKSQENAVKHFMNNPLFTKALVDGLEEDGTDIVIKPWQSSDRVTVELSTDLDFMGLKVTPRDKYGYPIKTTFNADSPYCPARLKDALASHWFFDAADKLNLASPINTKTINDKLYSSEINK